MEEPVNLYQQAKALFEELDRNKDGVISSAEIRLLYPTISEEEIREIFDTFDKQMKGVLTFEEIYHLIEFNSQSQQPVNSQEINENLDNSDKNNFNDTKYKDIDDINNDFLMENKENLDNNQNKYEQDDNIKPFKQDYIYDEE